MKLFRAKEVGKKISGANESRIRDAVDSLSSILQMIAAAGDPEVEAVAKEAAAVAMTAAPTLDDVRNGLQKLIDLLSPAAKEQLEGGEAEIVTRVGESIREGFVAGLNEIMVSLREAPAAPNANPTPAPTVAAPGTAPVARPTGPAAAPSVPLPCPSCEKTMPPTASFCASCGAKMDGAREAESIDITGMIVLKERSVGRDGVAPIKIIQDGWGASGYYPRDVLERDIPKVFPKGTKMYWDHPSASEEHDRPERSLRDLAAETIGTPRWDDNGPEGPGMYTEAKVFSSYQPIVDELAPHIGVSINAGGRGSKGSRDGRVGNILEEIVRGNSIDFVTAPGAGGRVVKLFESARGRNTNPTPSKEDDVDLKEAQGVISERDKEIARLRETVMIRESQDFLVKEIRKYDLPAPAQRRLIESVSADPPTVEDDDGKVTLDKTGVKKKLAEAVREEVEYLAQIGVGNGKVRTLSESHDDPGEEGDDDGNSFRPRNLSKIREADKLFEGELEESFKMLGLSDTNAKEAARGRAVR